MFKKIRYSIYFSNNDVACPLLEEGEIIININQISTVIFTAKEECIITMNNGNKFYGCLVDEEFFLEFK